MEVKIPRTAYYFSWPDEEILDAKLLEISGDDETWLYKIDQRGFNGHVDAPTRTTNHHTPSGAVDSRTFTRRKHLLRPSLESVAESPMSNRSSLGLLSTSRLNDTNLANYSTLISTKQEKISSNFIVSDNTAVPRVFKLDTPFMNSPFERKRLDSEMSDGSFIPSLDSQFDKNETMTDSMVSFLEKNERFQPPIDYQDKMTESLVSFSGKENGEICEEAMTNSMLSFLDPFACKPPSGFEDEDMNNSIVNIDEKDILPSSDMTSSLVNYLESGVLSRNLNETENIPPARLPSTKEESSNLNYRERLIDCKASGNLSPTFESKEPVDTTFNVEDGPEKSLEVISTNNVNISRTNRVSKETKDDFRKPLNTTFEKENEGIHKSRALNNKDLNVTHDLNGEANLTKYKIPNRTISAALMNSRLNGTFTRSGNERSINSTFTKSSYDAQLNGTFTKSVPNCSSVNQSKQNLNNYSNVRKIPQRNSTFNTTFTKLDSPPSEPLPNAVSRSTECLDAAEDDRTSSASDSSFSSAASSNKPCSLDELRSIAQQQESSLVQTSTPTDKTARSDFDLEFSPISRRMSLEGRRVIESRSAHCSPVRSSIAPKPQPISRLQQPITEVRRQALQASSLSNITATKPRTGASGLRMPSRLVRPETRPITAPAPTSTAIPRPQASRLPMPRYRTTGIPLMMNRGKH